MTHNFGIKEALAALGIKEINDGSSTGQNNFSNGEILSSFSPVDGKLIAQVKCSTAEDYQEVMSKASAAFKEWRTVPAPKRGEIVRLFGQKLREKKAELGKLVSYDG